MEAAVEEVDVSGEGMPLDEQLPLKECPIEIHHVVVEVTVLGRRQKKNNFGWGIIFFSKPKWQLCGGKFCDTLGDEFGGGGRTRMFLPQVACTGIWMQPSIKTSPAFLCLAGFLPRQRRQPWTLSPKCKGLGWKFGLLLAGGTGCHTPPPALAEPRM